MSRSRREGNLDRIVYWTTLLVLVTANFFAAIVLIPFLLFASGFHFYLIVAVLGIFFGYVFSMLLRNIQHLDVHHHFIAILFIPIFAVINLIIISTSLNGIALAFGLGSLKDPMVVGAYYVLFFIAPYALVHIRKE